MGELKVELSDDEDKASGEDEASSIDGDDGPGRQPLKDLTSSKRSSADSRLRRSSRLVQRHQGNTTQRPFRSFDNSSFHDGSFPAALLQDQDQSI